MIEPNDIVGYSSDTKRRLLGDMIVVNILPNNRVDVRKVEGEQLSIWQEYVSDLFLVKKHGNGDGI